MFSPYYAWARRRGATDPRNHCALNVALYSPRGKRWAMTERGARSLRQDAATLGIGPSTLIWDGNALRFQIDEVTVPFPSRIRGEVRIIPDALVRHTAILDQGGRHRWCPIAPVSRVEVSMGRPDLRWSGSAYFDSNHGDEPLETSIRSWNWSRADVRRGSAVIYDVIERSGNQTALSLCVDARGAVSSFPPPQRANVKATGWRLPRTTRSEDGCARLDQTLEDTPFYARSVLSTRLLGQPVTSIHEYLSLDRFRSPVVQAMLPFRMPRAR